MKDMPRRSRCIQITSTLLAAVLLAVASLLLMVPTRVKESAASEDLNVYSLVSPQSQERGRNAQIRATYAHLPLSFEANEGQPDQRVAFLSRGHGYTLFLTPSEAVFSLTSPESSATAAPSFLDRNHLGLTSLKHSTSKKHNRPDDRLLTMQVVGASPTAKMTGLNAFPGNSNYFMGSDPKRWRTGVANYAKVECKSIYPGVDLVYYGNHQQLEYDFVVAPGGDPSRIKLTIAGAEAASRGWSSSIDAQGDLVIRRDGSEVRFHKPVVYQAAADSETRTPVDGRYVLQADNEIGFEVGAYDRNRPLVIDPTLSYSTYLGGTGDEGGLGIAIDAAGNSYIAGYTTSTNFPTLNPVQAAYAGGPEDVFVAKFDPTGSTLLYSTYLGGAGDDVGEGIAVDPAGNAYVTGYTTSTDFPTLNAFHVANGGLSDAFVTKFNSTGALVYSTYLGGKGNDIGYGIAVDALGNAYVAGQVSSGNFPLKGAFQNRLGGASDAFVTKLNPAGNGLVYSTFLGGVSFDRAYAITVDSAGAAYVTGSTASTNFPLLNPYQSTLGSNSDAFIAKLNPTGKTLVYSTYLGGNNVDSPSSIAVDAAGNAYVAGGTASTNFPLMNPFQSTRLGANAAFITELNPTGTGLVFSTYMSGSLDDFGSGIGVDGSGNIFVTGYTRSQNFPTLNPVQLHLRGAWNIFVAEFRPGGSALVYSTYLGGRYVSWSYRLAVDPAGDVYVTGGTQALNFPVKNAFQSTNAGGYDAFVVKIAP
jgi:hypothetical protein